LKMAVSSSEIPFESLPWDSGNPSCRSLNRLIPFAAEQYSVRAREMRNESTTVFLRSFMLAIATARYVSRTQHGHRTAQRVRGEASDRRGTSECVPTRYSSRTLAPKKGKNVIRRISWRACRSVRPACDFPYRILKRAVK
jgi:hypothetical protein